MYNSAQKGSYLQEYQSYGLVGINGSVHIEDYGKTRDLGWIANFYEYICPRKVGNDSLSRVVLVSRLIPSGRVGITERSVLLPCFSEHVI